MIVGSSPAALLTAWVLFPTRIRDDHLGRRQNLFQPREEVERRRRRREVGHPVPDGPVLHLSSPERCMFWVLWRARPDQGKGRVPVADMVSPLNLVEEMGVLSQRVHPFQ